MGLHLKSLNEKSSKGELGFISQPFGCQWGHYYNRQVWTYLLTYLKWTSTFTGTSCCWVTPLEDIFNLRIVEFELLRPWFSLSIGYLQCLEACPATEAVDMKENKKVMELTFTLYIIFIWKEKTKSWNWLSVLYIVIQMCLEHLQRCSLCDLAKLFFISKFRVDVYLVIYFFATPSTKLKLGQQIGGGWLIANHLDQSLWWAEQQPKPFSWAKSALVEFPSSNFTV